MITGVLALLFVVALICSVENGEWGSTGVSAVIILVLLLLGHESREQDRAYNNAVEYWAKGGPKK